MNMENTNVADKKGKILKQIVAWSLGKEKFLNIISPPYNLSNTFIEIILGLVSLDKRVLYITNEGVGEANIINEIKKKSSFRKYVYFKENSDCGDALLVIAKHKMLNKFKEQFDLVIYDDIKSFSLYTKEEIAEASIMKSKINGKVISYSIEKIFNNSREIILPVRENNYPMIEPKFISTRIDINKDIPYVIYEYLEWSINSDNRVIVYVPDEERVVNVYKYLSKYCSKFSESTLYFIKNKNDKNILYKFINMKSGIVITNHFNDIEFDLNNINVMVFFADDKYFDYKKLVYLCGKVGRNERALRGEVIFLGNYETEDIDKSKEITRYFNKEAWEMDLLRL
jgi:late competence protein required for DNA uptake (superfamily II DNA/RNA helicase)